MGNEGLKMRNPTAGVEDDGEDAAPALAPARRAMRADARRNVERLIAVARQAFEEKGADASLDEIARRAGVGPGTLYRHFPTRGALVEAVYLEGVGTLCETGQRLRASDSPRDALVDWLKAFAAFAAQKRALSGALLDSMDHRDRVFHKSHELITTTASELLDRAKADGSIRPDVELNDVIRLASAIAYAGERSPEGSALSERLLVLALEGLTPRPSEG